MAEPCWTISRLSPLKQADETPV